MGTDIAVPFFSVIMNVYNGERFVGRAIESVIRQTYTGWELIVVDDASTDGTAEILARYAAQDPRIRVIRNPKNLHVGPSSNIAIRTARGKWIGRIDADDVHRPEFLQKMHDRAERLTVKDRFLSSWVTAIDEEDRKILDIRLPDGEKIRRMMPHENFLYHTATCYPKSLWEKTGGYVETRAKSHDAMLWKQFFDAGASVEMLPEFLIEYRIHSGNMTTEDASIDLAAAQKGFRPNREWRISLYLKQQMAREARRDILELRRVEKKLSAKNAAYLLMTFLPASWARMFMWELRPRFRSLSARFRKTASV